MSQKEFTAEQSMALIHEMINKARFNFAQGSFYFIVWGVLLMAAAVFEYVFHDSAPDRAYLGWPIAGILGGVLSMWYGSKMSREEALTHLDRIYSGIWVTYLITLFILIVAMVSRGMDPGSYIMILTGFPTFLTGLILRFRPLQLGGVVFWIFGTTSVYYFEGHTSLIFAVAVGLGYLTPGLLMKSMKKEHV